MKRMECNASLDHSNDNFSVENPEQFQKMPEEYKSLVIRQMMVHTEGELSGADDYIELFYPMTNDPYEKQICCDRAKEEIEHYTLGSKVLKDIGIDTAYMLDQKLEDRELFGTEAVKEINNWAERGLFSYLGESAVLEMLKEMAESSYRPIAEMCVPVIKDEHVHVAHGYRIVRSMCATEEGKKEVQSALQRMWPVTLDMFGKSDSSRSKLYLKWKLRQKSNEEARNDFIGMMAPKLEGLGLAVPDNLESRKFL